MSSKAVTLDDLNANINPASGLASAGKEVSVLNTTN